MYLQIGHNVTIDFDKVTHFSLVNNSRIDFYFGEFSEPGHFDKKDAEIIYKKLLSLKNAKSIADFLL
jgi:hypothetical protein